MKTRIIHSVSGTTVSVCAENMSVMSVIQLNIGKTECHGIGALLQIDQARDLIACLEAAIRDADPVPIDPEILDDPEYAASRIAHEHVLEYANGAVRCTCGWYREKQDWHDRDKWVDQMNRAHGAHVALTEGLAS